MGSVSRLFPKRVPEAGSEAGFQPPRQACILCVDDDRNVLAALSRLLHRQGYRVLTAASGAAGLEALNREPVDLVISDMRMPEMDGTRFLILVQQRWPDTMRLLLTGFADYQAIRDAITHGEICRYIAKPWDDGDILQAVQQAIGLDQPR
ncbi:response regulator [Pseudoduganella sp. LjRoot289]|uniref:response regulator n=1 Tax=Pseudoduganella sp. LjRoot289 TaxID=3342314 RepID=UPI003ECDAC16